MIMLTNDTSHKITFNVQILLHNRQYKCIFTQDLTFQHRLYHECFALHVQTDQHSASALRS